MENHNNSLPDGGLMNGNAEEEEVGSFLFINSSTCNWDNSMDQNDPFESALSSMVSSPVTSSYGGGGGGGENIVVRELIGRLGGICNSDENGISPHSYNNIGGNGNNHSEANTSCYTTPLNSPPKLNLSSIRDHQNQIRGNFPLSGSHSSFVSSDPGFAPGRAPRYSCFTNKNNADFGHRLVPKVDSSVSGISSNHSINIPGSQMHIQDMKLSKFLKSENSGFGDSSMDISSLTEQITRNENVMIGPNEDNPRKRKSVPKEKTKEPTSLNSSKDANVASENTDTNAKRSKSKEDNGLDKDGTKVKEESNGSDKTAAGDGKDNINAKLPEPPKDYIHVRARRGQATDAHSLAERVRREKISEKMTFLQDLVPGCNKVTGKAVMLDEIINYVQSLQHQVEFLSMKLATINPRSDFNAEAHLSKDVIQTQVPLHHMHNMYPSDPYPLYPPQGPNVQSAMPNGIEVVYSMNHLNAANGRDTSIIQLPPSNNFSELPSQVTTYWGDDLHSVVQMGLGQNETQNSMGSRQQHK